MGSGQRCRARLSALLLMMMMASLVAEEATPSPVAVEPLRLLLPAGLESAEAPPGTRAAWRSGDGLAALAVVERELAAPPPLAEQLAELQALGQDVLLEIAGEPLAGGPWRRLRYRITLGPLRFVQEVRIAAVDGRQLVVTASWPEDESARWEAPLLQSLASLRLE